MYERLTRLQCAAAIIAGRIVPVEKCISLMGITRWVTRYACFHAASCSLRYGDTVEAAEAKLKSGSNSKGDKQVISLMGLKDQGLGCLASSKRGRVPWVVDEFFIDRPSSDAMLLRKESASSGIWFDALYSVISAFVLHGRDWEVAQEQQIANYNAWCNAALSQRLHVVATATHAETAQRCIAAVDGGSMKLVSSDPKFEPLSMNARCADRNAVLNGLYFTPTSQVSVNPAWGVIVTDVHITSARDMYSYGPPVSIALNPLLSWISPAAAAAALASAIKLRSKPNPDIKVAGQVKIWIYETGLRYDAKLLKGFSAHSTSLVLDGRTFSTSDEDSGPVSLYVSHCTGILPVIPHARHSWMFTPIPSERTVVRSYFVKIANLKVVLKSKKQPSHIISDLVHADVVFQTSSESARDQWISKLYALKKSSIVAPPLLSFVSPPSLHSTEASARLSPPLLKPPAPTIQLAQTGTEPISRTRSPALCVILPISNPIAFRRREQLFHETLSRMLEAATNNPSLCVVSVRLSYKSNVAPGIRRTSHGLQLDRHYVDLQLETSGDDVLWAKENLINLGIKWVMAHELLGGSVEVGRLF